MFSLTTEKIFVSLPWCGCLVPVTTVTLKAIGPRKALTIVFRAAEVGGLRLVETTYTLEYASGLVIEWVENWVERKAAHIKATERRTSVGAVNATRQQEPALTH